MASPTHFRFFDLPVELRNEIYSQIIHENDHYDIDKPHIPAISRTSRQLRQEFLPIFYGKGTFHIPIKTNIHDICMDEWSGVADIAIERRERNKRLDKSSQQVGRIPYTITEMPNMIGRRNQTFVAINKTPNDMALRNVVFKILPHPSEYLREVLEEDDPTPSGTVTITRFSQGIHQIGFDFSELIPSLWVGKETDRGVREFLCKLHRPLHEGIRVGNGLNIRDLQEIARCFAFTKDLFDVAEEKRLEWPWKNKTVAQILPGFEDA